MAVATSDFFPINQLPDDILLKILGWGQEDPEFPSLSPIFPYCPPFNLLLPPIASVCSRWRRLYFEPQMWRSKFLYVPPKIHQLRPDSQFFTVLNRMAGEIHSLGVQCCGYTGFSESFTPLRWLPTFPHVENLSFRGPPRDFGLLVEKFPAVQSVDIDSDENLDDAVLLQMASGWENLRKFNISRCTEVTGTGLIRFVQVANHIESLNISSFGNVTDRDFDDVTMALGVGLKSVTFGFGYGQKNLSGLAIISLVQNCPQLEQICLEGPLPIGRLKDLAQLRRLKLHFDTNFGTYDKDCQGLEELFSRPLGQFRSFEAKGVGNLTDSHLELIANRCPQLECLSIDVCIYTGRNFGFITDSGLAYIVNNCRNLRVLCLRGFPLLTGRSFIGAGAKLPNLSRLELHKCENIDAEMVRRAFVRSTRLQIKSDLDGPWDLRRF